jgi:hypothetical protein
VCNAPDEPVAEQTKGECAEAERGQRDPADSMHEITGGCVYLVAACGRSDKPAQRLKHVEHGKAGFAAIVVLERARLALEHGLEKREGHVLIEGRLHVVHDTAVELVQDEEARRAEALQRAKALMLSLRLRARSENACTVQLLLHCQGRICQLEMGALKVGIAFLDLKMVDAGHDDCRRDHQDGCEREQVESSGNLHERFLRRRIVPRAPALRS